MNRTEQSLVRIVPYGETMMTNSQKATVEEASTTDNESPEPSKSFYAHFACPEPLNHNGKQKSVYRATWKPIKRKVIVKYHDGEQRTALTEMELVAHPLSLAHPNIVETHVVGSAPELFLVEREVTPLHNDWPLSGMDEAVTLLCHIARALSFLRWEGYIHADIKPENLGLDRGRFILMDFGVCKKLDKFDRATDKAGTVRTRAPEVLAKSSPRSDKSDLWSLAASLFRIFTKKFPLVLEDEDARLDRDESFRDQLTEAVAERAKDEELWNRDFWENDCWKAVPPHLQRLEPLMRRMLERDPDKRINAEGVVRCCEEEFAPYLLEDLPTAPIGLTTQTQMLPTLQALIDGKAGAGFKKSLTRLPLLTCQRHTQWLKELLSLNHLSKKDEKQFIKQQLAELEELEERAGRKGRKVRKP
ncbi:MAG TPA: protein kinase [Pseudomonadota bacterium]|nr:protein kinase [Pseudomonadota bacterium]